MLFVVVVVVVGHTKAREFGISDFVTIYSILLIAGFFQGLCAYIVGVLKKNTVYAVFILKYLELVTHHETNIC